MGRHRAEHEEPQQPAPATPRPPSPQVSGPVTDPILLLAVEEELRRLHGLAASAPPPEIAPSRAPALPRKPAASSDANPPPATPAAPRVPAAPRDLAAVAREAPGSRRAEPEGARSEQDDDRDEWAPEVELPPVAAVRRASGSAAGPVGLSVTTLIAVFGSGVIACVALCLAALLRR